MRWRGFNFDPTVGRHSSRTVRLLQDRVGEPTTPGVSDAGAGWYTTLPKDALVVSTVVACGRKSLSAAVLTLVGKIFFSVFDAISGQLSAA